jgi:hypothetical protein
VIHVNVTPAATTGTSEETLMSFSLPANALNVNGRGLRITVAGETAANANSKTFTITFGSVTLVTATGAYNGIGLNASATLLRSGVASFVARTSLFGGTTPLAFTASVSSGGTDLTAAVTIAVKATTATAIGDATATFLLVEILN